MKIIIEGGESKIKSLVQLLRNMGVAITNEEGENLIPKSSVAAIEVEEIVEEVEAENSESEKLEEELNEQLEDTKKPKGKSKKKN